MNQLLVIILFLIGLLLIIKGGDYFVDSAVWFAEALNVPKFIIGATIVSFATTLPELLVSLFASLEGKNVMAAGNAIGSVSANLGLIMGISLVCIPAAIKRREFAFKGILMALTCFLLWFFSKGGNLGFAESLVLIFCFIVFMAENTVTAKKNMDASEKAEIDKKDLGKNILFFVIGIAGIVLGSQLLVDNGSEIARMFGISEGIISVTIIAIGTSLPELVTTLTAISKKQSSLSVGNIIGANIIDLALILPLCSLASGGNAAIEMQTYAIDIPVCFGIILLAITPPLLFGRLYRSQGFLLLMTYAAYITYVCVTL